MQRARLHKAACGVAVDTRTHNLGPQIAHFVLVKRCCRVGFFEGAFYDFAHKHRLTITYHTGSCALILESDNALEDSNAIYVQNVAKKYPDVNFVVAHMDDPRYDECIRILHETPNMFSDFSGAYEPGTPEGSSMDWAIETFARAIHQFPDTYKSMLYGTDFCPPINLEAIEDYDVTIERIFAPDMFEAIYHGNCLRAFPRLADYLKGV